MMKKRWRQILMIATTSVLIALLLTLAVPPAQAQGTFPLQCRGGGQVNMVYDTVARTVFTRFRPAPGPAGNGLAAGQCSWLDRALRPGEPRQICTRNITQGKIFWSPNGYTISLPQAQYLSNMLYDRFTVTVEVYNDGECMRIVRVLGA
jgi:hypothetical protein